MELPLVLAVHASVPGNTLKDMLAYAKAHPGKLNYGVAGPGDPTLHFERLKRDSGADIVQVSYKGAGPQTQALIANEVQMAFPPVFTALPEVKAGRLRVLAVTGDKRVSAFPDAPTLAELGYNGIRNVWQGVLMPKGTPASVINAMQGEIAVVLRMPDIVQKFADFYWFPVGSTPAEFRARIDTDIREWSEIAKAANIQPE
jgi:tripartite-type tricarboxylate transporter receptor subunit TctC